MSCRILWFGISKKINYIKCYNNIRINSFSQHFNVQKQINAIRQLHYKVSDEEAKLDKQRESNRKFLESSIKNPLNGNNIKDEYQSKQDNSDIFGSTVEFEDCDEGKS